jgi:hypothetical protein
MRILITGGAGFVGSHLGNVFIQVLFRTSCNDISNAFKMYRRSVIAGIQPLFAQHFNLTVELPLKSIGRGYRYAVVPNTWINRKQGVSKFPPLRGRHARRAQPAGASRCLTIILTKITGESPRQAMSQFGSQKGKRQSSPANR